jgi:hypothetical protein
MDLPEHIERYLGKIEYGWSLKGEMDEVQAVKISNVPVQGVVAYSTLGLSRNILRMPRDRTVRIELLFAAYERYESSKIASFLLTFGQYVVSGKRSPLRGDVIGPEKPLIPGVRSDSIYCALPVMFNPGLATFSESSPPTVFIWLMPITNLEADFVRTKGWNAFEDCFVRNQPDFWDLDRPSLAGIRPAS